MSSSKWQPFCLSLNVLMQKRCNSSAIAMTFNISSASSHQCVVTHLAYRYDQKQCWPILNKLQGNLNSRKTFSSKKMHLKMCHIILQMLAILFKSQSVKTIKISHSEYHEIVENFKFYWEQFITEVLTQKITVFFFFSIFFLLATPRRHSFNTPVVILHVQGFILKSRCHAQVKLNPLYIESWSLTLYVQHSWWRLKNCHSSSRNLMMSLSHIPVDNSLRPSDAYIHQ